MKHTRTRLAALATLAAYASTSHKPAVAQAVPNQAASGKQAGTANLPVQRFDIPAGPLKAALDQFESITALKVQIALPRGMASPIEGFKTDGVTGLYSSEAALRLLLADTGLTYKLVGANVVQIAIRHDDSVDVTAALPNEVSMPKFSQPLLDTPQSVAVVPQFILQDEGVSTLRDSLRNVPGISLAAGEAGAQGDNLTLRGFTARNDIFLDGIRDFGSYYRDSFNYEQVEALEGPAGIEFGRGSTGGVINQESKIPQATPSIDVQTQFGTNLERRVTADINQPLPEIGKGTAFRLNAMVDESGVAGRPFAEIRRFGLAPSVTIGLNSPTRFTLSYFHLTESDTPDYGLPWFYNKLAPGVQRSAYYGFGDENYLKTSDDILTARLDHDFGHSIALHSTRTRRKLSTLGADHRAAGLFECDRQRPGRRLRRSHPHLLRHRPYLPLHPRHRGPRDHPRQPQRNSGEERRRRPMGSDRAHRALQDLRAPSPEFTGGIEGGQEISNPIRYGYSLKAAGSSISLNTVPYTTLLNPNTSQVFGGTGYITSVVWPHQGRKRRPLFRRCHPSRSTLRARRRRSAGIRFDTGYNAWQPTPPAGGAVTAAASLGSFTRVDQQPTYRAALVYKPSTHGSVYFDYGTSFNPSAESLALTSITQNVFAPEENETYELGAKASFLNEHLMMEGALFRTEKDNARETDPTNSNNIVLSGNQLVKGIQYSVVGRLPEGTDLVAGYAYLDSAVIYSPFYPTSVGYQLANVPKQTFNLFVTHRLPGRFNIGLGGNYVASRTASSTTPYVPLTFGTVQTFAAGAAPCGTAVTVTCYQVTSIGMKQVPGYWVFNAMVRRSISDHIDLQANVNNLLNRFFIDAPHPSHLVPGEGLNALIGLNFKF